MGFNNTSYTNEKGKEILANADIKYRKNFYGFMLPSSGEAATDTIVTLTPDAPGATTQRITLSGNNSKTETLDNTGMWIPSNYSNYWIPRGREAVRNMGNQPGYLDQFIKKIGFKQQGGSMQQQDIQKQIVALVQAAMQGDQKATQTVNQIMEAAKAGDQQATQLAQLIQKVVKQMQGQATAAKWGAKLGYIKSLKYAKGGKTCKACQGGSKIPTSQDKAYIKPTKKVEKKACGGKKAKKRYFGGWL